MYFKVRVYPRSKHTFIKIDSDGLIKVHLSAVPVDGKANVALIDFLAKSINYPRSKIAIVKGFNSRNKLIEITGLKQSDIEKIILPNLNLKKR